MGERLFGLVWFDLRDNPNHQFTTRLKVITIDIKIISDIIISLIFIAKLTNIKFHHDC